MARGVNPRRAAVRRAWHWGAGLRPSLPLVGFPANFREPGISRGARFFGGIEDCLDRCLAVGTTGWPTWRLQNSVFEGVARPSRTQFECPSIGVVALEVFHWGKRGENVKLGKRSCSIVANTLGVQPYPIGAHESCYGRGMRAEPMLHRMGTLGMAIFQDPQNSVRYDGK